MFFDRKRPHAFREQRVTLQTAADAARRAVDAAEQRAARAPTLQAYAVHFAQDRTRVVTVEAWQDRASYEADADAGLAGSTLYAWAATGGQEPTPVTDTAAGVIIIDLFTVWRPLLGPVSKFNIRNGEAFNREPGCISTTVLRSLHTGGIATYARWRSPEDFAAAFAKLSGKPARCPDDVNVEAARMTFGFIRPDYHAYDLVASREVRS